MRHLKLNIKQVVVRLKRLILSRKSIYVILILAWLFTVVNIGLFLIYKNRAYSNTYINKVRLGAVAAHDLPNKLKDLRLLPDNIVFTGNNKTVKVSPATIGVSLDTKQIKTDSMRRSWLPLVNLIKKHNLPLSLKLDDSVFKQGFVKISQTFNQLPTEASISLADNNFVIKNETAGYSLDSDTVKKLVLTIIRGSSPGNNPSGKITINSPLVLVQPQRKQADLIPALNLLKAQQSTAVIYSYLTKSKQLTIPEINSFFVQKDFSYEIADSNISAVITSVGKGFGIKVGNLAQATAATKTAITNNKPATITLVAETPARKIFRYCVSAKGVDSSYLPDFEAKLASVYNDARGWSLGGQVIMEKSDVNCNFTAWLSAADQLPLFSTVCDSKWSCATGNNVIINFDRWLNSTDVWKGAGRTLDDYRTMVINHETGHWLGFGHKNCPAAGQPAPVMQQQSIDLQSCLTNQWPLRSELTAIKAFLRL